MFMGNARLSLPQTFEPHRPREVASCLPKGGQRPARGRGKAGHSAQRPRAGQFTHLLRLARSRNVTRQPDRLSAAMNRISRIPLTKGSSGCQARQQHPTPHGHARYGS